jgi:peptidyl-prolyl cis-trans isomerase B (cyclophilin B)
MHGVRNSMFGVVAAVGILASSFAFATGATTAAPASAKAGTNKAGTNKAGTNKAAASKSQGKATGMDEVAVLDTSKGKMVVEFWDKDAPKTVAHFKALAKSGFYNGTGFHRIMKNFMIQGGDPKSKNPKAPDLGTGGSGQTVPDEYNNHTHVKGVLSLASSGTGTNSGDSQFFIVHGEATFLDHKYTAFGHVIKGLDVVDKIAAVPVGPNPMMNGEPSKPLEWVTLKSVTIMPKSQAMASSEKAAPKKGATASSSKGTGTAKSTEAAKPAENAAAGTPPASTPAASETPAAAAGGAPTDSTKK